MSIRSHLFLLTLVVLFPIVLYGIGTTLLIAERERSLFEQGARERTHALLTAVDTELEGYMTSLVGLASSQNLQSGDIAAFHAEILRLMPTQPDWRSVRLIQPSGKVVLSAAKPFGTALSPLLDISGLTDALRRNEPSIGTLTFEEGGYRFSVRMPVIVNDEPHVLAVSIAPDAIVSILTTQRLPPDWVGVVLDGERNIVARTINQASLVGQPASQSLRTALEGSAEGWFPGATIEGTRVYTPYSRSAFSGWTVAFGIPAGDVEATSSNTAWMLSLGLLSAIIAALLLAAALSRRISTPIGSLAAAANALGQGAPVSSLADSRVSEVRDVSHALATAARLVGEREERLRAADKAKNEFLAMLGHELRNPLGALISATELLRASNHADGTAQEAISVVTRQIQQMSRLVKDLLDVGRVTSGKVTLDLLPLDLAQVVSHAVRNLRSSPLCTGHDISCETSSVWIRGDETRIEQIVSNLLDNALKFTPEGGGIRVTVSKVGDQAELKVADTGIGLTADLKARVFDLFTQGEQAIERSGGGLGIGLTLVKYLTELHGGSVTVDSEGPQLGACFTVHFPLSKEAPKRVTPTQSIPSAIEQRKIVLVEDNDDARTALQTVLGLYGYEVRTAADGLSGIATVREWQPDVAVIDIGIPNLDGYEVARQLRENPSSNGLLLIAVTGYGGADVQRKATESGFDACLTKPVSPAALAELIESHLMTGA